MNIAFPTNKGKKIARHGSFCQSFLIADTKTSEREIIDNPLKMEAAATGAQRDKSEGRHLGSGPIISELLSDAGVDLYVYFEAEANFLLHLQREGINVYKTQEKLIDIVLKTIEEKEDEMNQTQESIFDTLGHGMGLGRRFGQRAGRGLGKRSGIGQGIGKRGRGFGRGFGNQFK
ncbi:MAG: NifB/NifX family molybdenum-iron cluster-binding protein [Campylobacterota bacterium]|nr:NifB/NifX family molybdenum-iron cluster-binding protein [Campylobacterota bacterium]